MENYAILMFIFAGILFFYAALLCGTKNPQSHPALPGGQCER